jgi:hypothetical protein
MLESRAIKYILEPNWLALSYAFVTANEYINAYESIKIVNKNAKINGGNY